MTNFADLGDDPLTVKDLRDLGLSAVAVRSLVRSGLLRRVVTGVYVAAHVPDSHHLRAAALARVVAAGHVVVDRTAAWLHGVDAFTLEELGGVPPIEICALRGRHPTERGDAEGGNRDLAPHDLVRIGGLTATTPLRTALDLGCRLRRREAFAVLNALARCHGFGRAECHREVARRFKRRRGVVQLRELVDLMDPACESPRESWTLLAIRDAGLPAPVQQLWVIADGLARYRLDHAWEAARVVVEYDGTWHAATAEQQREDAERRAWLRAHGWTVIVVKVGDFAGDRLEAWLAELRDALRPTYSPRRW